MSENATAGVFYLEEHMKQEIIVEFVSRMRFFGGGLHYYLNTIRHPF